MLWRTHKEKKQCIYKGFDKNTITCTWLWNISDSTFCGRKRKTNILLVLKKG